jgi:hypothetical protein
VVPADHPADAGGVAEVREQLVAVAGMAPDDGELLVVQGTRLAENGVWDGELAHVVQETAERQLAQAPGGEPELVADGDRQLRDAARVLLGRAVLALQAHHEGAHARAEERLLGGDELRCREVADDGVRRLAAPEVERDRDADERDAEQLERVAGPPRPGAGLEQEDGDEREAEPGHADDDEQVRGAAGEREGADGAQGDDEVEADADDEEADGDAAARLRQLRDDARVGEGGDAGHRDGAEERADGDGGRAQAVVAPQRGQGSQGEHRAADRQRRAAREGDDPVGADEHAGRRQAVDDEQQRHRAEGAAGDQRPAVAAAHAGDRQRDAGERRDRRADGHDREVTDAGHRRLTAARERVQGGRGHGGAACDEEQM